MQNDFIILINELMQMDLYILFSLNLYFVSNLPYDKYKFLSGDCVKITKKH